MKCQIFGHIARNCWAAKPVCGKCTSTNHETGKCNVSEDKYKCHHCKGNHRTGDRNCQVIIDKWEQLNPQS